MPGGWGACGAWVGAGAVVVGAGWVGGGCAGFCVFGRGNGCGVCANATDAIKLNMQAPIIRTTKLL
jgi:hypothetical protein